MDKISEKLKKIHVFCFIVSYVNGFTLTCHFVLKCRSVYIKKRSQNNEVNILNLIKFEKSTCNTNNVYIFFQI